MLALLLTLAVLPQGQQQARLHPADTLVMVEIPDVTKMVAAYQKAPMVAMLHDAEVRKSFYGAFEGTEIDFDQIMTEALREVGMPDSFAESPLAGIRHYLDGISAASFSLSLDRVGLEKLGPRVERMGRIETELGVLQSAIEGYQGEAKAVGSTLPKDLAALGLDASACIDPWKHPYDYRPAEDGTFVLRSLGADRKPGGTGDDADITAAQAGESGAEFANLLGFQTVIEFKNQVALEELRTIISGLIAKSDLTPARTGPFQMSGMQAELQSWNGPEGELEGTELWLMRAQNMLVFGAGRSTPEAFAARLADSRMQTAADQFYAVLLKEFGAPSGVTIVQGSLHLADYASAFRSFGEATGGDNDALEFLESVLFNASIRMQLIGDRFVTEAAAKYIQPKGLVAKGLGLAPLPKELMSSVPEDAIGVYATSMDGPLFWEAFKSEFEKDGDDAESAQEQLTALEERYGFSVEKDIFGSVGKGMLMYLLPLKGVTSIPGMALVVDLKDPAAMQRGLEGLMSALSDEVGEDFKVRAKPYRDAPVWTFTFGKEDGPSNPLMNAFSPSIAIVKSRLIVTLNSTHIKKEIKRAFGEEGSAHLIATEGHGPPADATSFAYMDWAALINGMYEGGRALGGLMGSAVPVDLAKLPQPGVFTRFFKPTVFYSRTIPDGVYYRNESSFGPEVWSGLVGIGLVAGFASQSEMHDESFGAEDEMSEPDEAPESPEPPAVDKQRLQTSGDIRHLATSIAVYQMEGGKLPAKLDALLLPTKNYPEGFVGQKTLPNDGWGHGFQYSLLDGGKRYRLWSIGPDGVDQSGSGDDIVSP